MRQLELIPAQAGGAASEDDLCRLLNQGNGTTIEVVLTENRVNMVLVSFDDPSRVRCRLHRAFLGADERILRALRTFCRTRRRDAWNTVSGYAQSIVPADHAPAPPRPAHTRGAVHDLDRLCRKVNRDYFNQRVRCSISWGRAPARRRRPSRSKSIRFGSWCVDTRRITIHPALDDTRVPAGFIEFIIYHEMLHSLLPPVIRNGKRHWHTERFRQLERAHPEYEAMEALAVQLLRDLV